MHKCGKIDAAHVEATNNVQSTFFGLAKMERCLADGAATSMHKCCQELCSWCAGTTRAAACSRVRMLACLHACMLACLRVCLRALLLPSASGRMFLFIFLYIYVRFSNIFKSLFLNYAEKVGRVGTDTP